MTTAKFDTFTVSVHVFPWLHSESDASAHLLCDYLEDIAETLDFIGTATACVIESKACLWFTFSTELDAVLFRSAIDELWNKGGWLIS